MMNITWKYDIGTAVRVRDGHGEEFDRERSWEIIDYSLSSKKVGVVGPAYTLRSHYAGKVSYSGFAEEALVPDESSDPDVKLLAGAINTYTAIAPAFAEQMAEMLMNYYGPNPEREK